MIFYVAVDADGRKHLAGTQADARAINRQFEQIDIPTDKASLMSFVQDLFDQVGTEEAPEAVSVPVQAPPPRPLQPTGVDHDGHPRVRAAFTGVQLEAMFTRRSEHVQDICFAISKLQGPDLGYVAFEVAARLTQNIVMPSNIAEPVDA